MESIEVLVTRLVQSDSEKEKLYDLLLKKAVKMGINLSFRNGDVRYFATTEGVKEGWYTNSHRDTGWDETIITPEEYLDALRLHLIERLKDSEMAEADLRDLILRFTTKKTGYHELKEAVG